MSEPTLRFPRLSKNGGAGPANTICEATILVGTGGALIPDCDSSPGDNPLALPGNPGWMGYAVACVERWLSGLRQRISVAYTGKPYRGFESFPSPPTHSCKAAAALTWIERTNHQKRGSARDVASRCGSL